MRVMIFGDSASGKSSFAERLASQFDLPLLHLDVIIFKRYSDVEKHLHSQQ